MGKFVDGILYIHLFDDSLFGNATEKAQLFSNFLGYGLLAATYENIRLNTDLAQFGYALLGWLCLQFASGS